jgi:ABC-type proline/glycine betaine transport system permease subunit
VTDAATAMGYKETKRLFAVELPLALPAIVAGPARRDRVDRSRWSASAR